MFLSNIVLLMAKAPWFAIGNNFIVVHIFHWYHNACAFLLYTILAIALLYKLGYVHRFLWYILEMECTKILNGTPVTAGMIQLDLLRGRVYVNNLVIHSPKMKMPSTTTANEEASTEKNIGSATNGTTDGRMNEQSFSSSSSQILLESTFYTWEAPVLARIGKAYVETNIVHCLLAMVFLLDFHQPVELYTIHISDIQVFIERAKHNNVYNFYLCDPNVIVPETATTVSAALAENGGASCLESTNTDKRTMYAGDENHVENCGQATTDMLESNASFDTHLPNTAKHSMDTKSVHANSLSPQLSTFRNSKDMQQLRQTSSTIVQSTGTSNNEHHERIYRRENAEKVVDDMVQAVRRAAYNGDWQNVLLQHRAMLADQVKALKSSLLDGGSNTVGGVGGGSGGGGVCSGDGTSSSNIEGLVKESVKVLKEVSASVVEKTQTATQVVLPARRSKRPDEVVVYGRIGRVLIENMRVYIHKHHQQHAKPLVTTMQTTTESLLNQKVDDVNSNNDSNCDDNFERTISTPPSNSSNPTTSIDATSKLKAELCCCSDEQNQIHQQEQEKDEKTCSTSNTKNSTLSASSLMLSSRWNKPIYIHRVAIGPSEFCPPLYSSDKEYDFNANFKDTSTSSVQTTKNTKDASQQLSEDQPVNNNGSKTTSVLNKDRKKSSSSSESESSNHPIPSLYQPMDKSLDIVIKRVFAEMIARSNTDRFFQAAIEEMAGVFFDTVGSKTQVNKTSSGSEVPRINNVATKPTNISSRTTKRDSINDAKLSVVHRDNNSISTVPAQKKLIQSPGKKNITMNASNGHSAMAALVQPTAPTLVTA